MPQTSALPLILVILAGVIIVGSAGPWATVAFVTANGLDGDGVYTLILGVGCAALAGLSFKTVSRRKYGGYALCSGLAAVVGVIDWTDIATEPEGPLGIAVEPGWGLTIMTLAALAGTVLSATGFWQVHRRMSLQRVVADAHGPAVNPGAAEIESTRDPRAKRDPFRRSE
jgi:hypothetical protein